MDVERHGTDKRMIAGVKRWLPLLILLLALGSYFYFDLGRYLSFSTLKQHRQMLLSWTHEHYLLSVGIFMLVYIISVAVSIPGASYITIVGGFLFGTIMGTIYVVMSATIGAVILFLAVRVALEPWIARKASRWVDKMRKGFQQGATEYLLFLRLVPIFPFWVVNIVPALLGISLRTYTITTFFGIIPGSLVYVMLGSGLGHLLDQDKTPNLAIIFEWPILLPILGLAVLSLVPVIYRWKKMR